MSDTADAAPRRAVLLFGHKVKLRTSSQEFLISTHSALAPVGAKAPTPSLSLAHTAQSFPVESSVFYFAPGDTERFTTSHETSTQDEIRYGQVVRLVHDARRLSLVHCASERATLERGAQRVTLQALKSKESATSVLQRTDRWRILPKYRVRAEGEKVCAGDVIVLQSTIASHTYLSLSSDSDARTDGAREGQCTPNGEGFEVVVFDNAALSEQALRAGQCVTLLHRETSRRLMVSQTGAPRRLALDVPLLSDTDPMSKGTASIDTLFVLERADSSNQGGEIRVDFGQWYRLRSIATGMYVAAVHDTTTTGGYLPSVVSSSEAFMSTGAGSPPPLLYIGLEPAADIEHGALINGSRVFLTFTAGPMQGPHCSPLWVSSSRPPGVAAAETATYHSHSQQRIVPLSVDSRKSAVDGFEIQRLSPTEYCEITSVVALLPPTVSLTLAFRDGDKITSNAILQCRANLRSLRRMCFQSGSLIVESDLDVDGVLDRAGQLRLLRQHAAHSCLDLVRAILHSPIVDPNLLDSDQQLLTPSTSETTTASSVSYADVQELLHVALSVIQYIIQDNQTVVSEMGTMLPYLIECCDVSPAACRCVGEFLRCGGSAMINAGVIPLLYGGSASAPQPQPGTTTDHEHPHDYVSGHTFRLLELREKQPWNAAVVRVLALVCASRDTGFDEAQHAIGSRYFGIITPSEASPFFMQFRRARFQSNERNSTSRSPAASTPGAVEVEVPLAVLGGSTDSPAATIFEPARPLLDVDGGGTGKHSSVWVPMTEISVMARHGSDHVLPFLVESVNLLAALCAGGNRQWLPHVFNGIISVELLTMLSLSPPAELPALLHASLLKLFGNAIVACGYRASVLPGSTSASSSHPATQRAAPHGRHQLLIDGATKSSSDRKFAVRTHCSSAPLDEVLRAALDYVRLYLHNLAGAMSSEDGKRQEIDAVAGLASKLLDAGAMDVEDIQVFALPLIYALDRRNDDAVNDPEVFSDKVAVIALLHRMMDSVVHATAAQLAAKAMEGVVGNAIEGECGDTAAVSATSVLQYLEATIARLPPVAPLDSVSRCLACVATTDRGVRPPLFVTATLLDVLMDIATVNSWPLSCAALGLYARLSTFHQSVARELPRFVVCSTSEATRLDALEQAVSSMERYGRSRMSGRDCANGLGLLLARVQGGREASSRGEALASDSNGGRVAGPTMLETAAPASDDTAVSPLRRRLSRMPLSLQESMEQQQHHHLEEQQNHHIHEGTALRDTILFLLARNAPMILLDVLRQCEVVLLQSASSSERFRPDIQERALQLLIILCEQDASTDGRTLQLVAKSMDALVGLMDVFPMHFLRLVAVTFGVRGHRIGHVLPRIHQLKPATVGALVRTLAYSQPERYFSFSPSAEGGFASSSGKKAPEARCSVQPLWTSADDLEGLSICERSVALLMEILLTRDAAGGLVRRSQQLVWAALLSFDAAESVVRLSRHWTGSVGVAKRNALLQLSKEQKGDMSNANTTAPTLSPSQVAQRVIELHLSIVAVVLLVSRDNDTIHLDELREELFRPNVSQVAEELVDSLRQIPSLGDSKGIPSDDMPPFFYRTQMMTLLHKLVIGDQSLHASFLSSQAIRTLLDTVRCDVAAATERVVVMGKRSSPRARGQTARSATKYNGRARATTVAEPRNEEDEGEEPQPAASLPFSVVDTIFHPPARTTATGTTPSRAPALAVAQRSSEDGEGGGSGERLVDVFCRSDDANGGSTMAILGDDEGVAYICFALLPCVRDLIVSILGPAAGGSAVSFVRIPAKTRVLLLSALGEVIESLCRFAVCLQQEQQLSPHAASPPAVTRVFTALSDFFTFARSYDDFRRLDVELSLATDCVSIVRASTASPSVTATSVVSSAVHQRENNTQQPLRSSNVASTPSPFATAYAATRGNVPSPTRSHGLTGVSEWWASVTEKIATRSSRSTTEDLRAAAGFLLRNAYLNEAFLDVAIAALPHVPSDIADPMLQITTAIIDTAEDDPRDRWSAYLCESVLDTLKSPPSSLELLSEDYRKLVGRYVRRAAVMLSSSPLGDDVAVATQGVHRPVDVSAAVSETPGGAACGTSVIHIGQSSDQRRDALAFFLEGNARRTKSTEQLLPIVTELFASPHAAVRFAAARCAVMLLDGGNKAMQGVLHASVVDRSDETVFVLLRRELAHMREMFAGFAKATRRRADPGLLLADLPWWTYLLRFVQLMCEGHFLPLQDYLRVQPLNIVSVNCIESLSDILSVLAADGASILSDATTHPFVLQLLATICETIQGPCEGNQRTYASTGACKCLVTMVTSNVAAHPSVDSIRSKAMECLLAMQEGRDELDFIAALAADIDVVSLTRAMDRNWTRIDGTTHPLELRNIPSAAGTAVIAAVIPHSLDKKKHDDEQRDLLANSFIFLQVLLDSATSMSANARNGARITIRLRDCNGVDIANALRACRCFRDVRREVRCVEIARSDADQSLERCYFRVPATQLQHLTPAAKQRVIRKVDRSSDAKRLQSFVECIDDALVEMDVLAAIHRSPLQRVIHWGSEIFASFVAVPLSLAMNVLLLATVHASTNPYDDPIQMRSVIFWVGVAVIIVQGWLMLGYLVTEARIRVLLEIREHHEKSNHLSTDRTAAAADSVASSSSSSSSGSSSAWIALTSLAAAVQAVLTDATFLALALFLGAAILGLIQSYVWYSVLVLQFVSSSPLLVNVLLAVTTNGRSLLLTLVLMGLVIYVFASISFYYFSEMFDPNHLGTGYDCQTLASCWYTHVESVRAGGGIGDIVSMPMLSSKSPTGITFATYKMFFFFFVIVIFLNIILGIIVDTFAQLREEREAIEADQQGKCFICGIDRNEFDRKEAGAFDRHVSQEHCMWDYLFLLHHVRTKELTELNGQEGEVYNLWRQRDIGYFPVGRSLRSSNREEPDTSSDPTKGTAPAMVAPAATTTTTATAAVPNASDVYRLLQAQRLRTEELMLTIRGLVDSVRHLEQQQQPQ